jgi:cytochrome P450
MIKSNFEMPAGTLIHDEPPIHTAHRQMLSRVFTPRAMTAIEPAVRAFCVGRLDPLVDADGFDVVEELSRQVPMRVFGMLLGIREDEQEAVRDHVEQGMKYNPKVDTYQGMGDAEFYAHFVDDRYANPGDDLVTRLVATEFEDETGTRRTLTRDEAIMYLNVIAGAGNHTTNRLIGWTAKVLAEHPDQRRAVVADRSLVNNTIEETLRFEPSSTQIARYVEHDVELYGRTVPAGSAILALAGSANRDERAFPDPDRFDVGRTFGHHLTFGYGPHFCLGAALARLEGRVVLEEMLNRFTDWEVDYEGCELGSTPGVRGYDALPIRITGRAS